MTKLEFFKKYCKLKGIEHKFGFGVVSENVIKIEFLNGQSTTHLMYKGEYVENDKLYKIHSATCGHDSDGTGLCFVGNPCQSCVDKGRYSENKCAVYSYDKPIDIDSFEYELTYEDLQTLFSF